MCTVGLFSHRHFHEVFVGSGVPRRNVGCGGRYLVLERRSGCWAADCFLRGCCFRLATLSAGYGHSEREAGVDHPLLCCLAADALHQVFVTQRLSQTVGVGDIDPFLRESADQAAGIALKASRTAEGRTGTDWPHRADRRHLDEEVRDALDAERLGDLAGVCRDDARGVGGRRRVVELAQRRAARQVGDALLGVDKPADRPGEIGRGATVPEQELLLDDVEFLTGLLLSRQLVDRLQVPGGRVDAECRTARLTFGAESLEASLELVPEAEILPSGGGALLRVGLRRLIVRQIRRQGSHSCTSI
jgi:hypothetical protein